VTSAPCTARTFPRRPHPDGTVDSICPLCFMTVAAQVPVSSLPPLEEAHICLSVPPLPSALR
jgi:hypothetical protein